MSDAGVQLQKYRMKYREEIEIYAARNYKNKDFVLYIIVGDYNKPPDQRPNVVGCRDMKSELLAAFPKGKGTNAKIYLAVGDQECCDEIYFETISIVGSNNRRRYYLIAGCIALILLVVLLAILLC